MTRRLPVPTSGMLLGLLVLLCLALPLLPLADPDATQLDQRLLPPLSPGHLLGTDPLGRDLLARVAYGARLSLLVAGFGVLLAAGLGSTLGLCAAYFGSVVDTLLMRLIDVMLAFPYLLLALGIVAVLGPGLVNATVAIALANVPFFARAVRGQTLHLMHEDFVAAARLAGYSDPRILWTEILPNVRRVVVTAMTTSSGWMILETAGLSFLGLGAQPPTADLGSMLGDARQMLSTAPHAALIPGAAILLIAADLNFLGDALATRELGQAEPLPDTALDRSSEPPLPHADALFAIHNLRVAIGPRVVLHGLSTRIRAGERVGLVGESGSGKSLFARSLLDLLPPQGRVLSGQILCEGRALAPFAFRSLRGRMIGYVPQDPATSLHPLRRIGAQLKDALRLDGTPEAELQARSAALLAQLNMPDPEAQLAAYPHQLSGGMRQRVALALALARKPKLLIADEPSTALDVTVQAQLLSVLREACARKGVALLFISHDLALVSSLCEKVLVMQHGRVVEEGATLELLRNPKHPYTRELLASAKQGSTP